MLPNWISSNKDAIATGSPHVDQVLVVLLETSMFVAGFLGFVLDNTIPGTDEERGLVKWKAQHDTSEGGQDEISQCYDLPFGMDLIRR